MTERPVVLRLLAVANVVIFGAVYAVMLFGQTHLTASYRLALAAGGLITIVAVYLTVRPRFVAAILGPSARWVRQAAVITPWVALLVLLTLEGLWWTQRFWALRFFATYALVNWSILWCSGWSGGRPANTGTQAVPLSSDGAITRTLQVLAVVLALLGIDGIVLGVSAFGVAASAVLTCVAAIMVTMSVFAGRAVRGNALAACFGVLLAFAGIEIGMRALHVGDSVAEVDSAEYVRDFHHITPPRSAFINRPKPLDEFAPALVETNSLGIRGREIPPGRVDLLLIGDSMIEARQLPWEQTLGPRLQQAFQARSLPVRVVAHGMRGWAPLLEWNWYLKVGRRLHPGTVLLFFFWNDLWPSGDEVHSFQAVMRPDGRPDHFDVIVESDWVWYKHVRAVRLAEEVLNNVGFAAVTKGFALVGAQEHTEDLASARAIARDLAGDTLLTPAQIQTLVTQPESQLGPKLRATSQTQFWPGIRPLAFWTARQRQAAAKTEAELKAFADDVASDGGRLVIVYVPNAYQISPSECAVSRYLEGVGDVVLPPDSGIQEWLRGVSARSQIELIDPSDAMRAFDSARPAGAPPLYLRADCHWAAPGHQFMADYLADWYVNRISAASK